MLPGPSQAFTPDRLEIQDEYDQNRVAFEHLVKQRSDGIPTHVLDLIPVDAAFKPAHYLRSVLSLVDSGIAILHKIGPLVTQNFVFGVLKSAGETKRLIGAGNRINFLFRGETFAFQLSTLDFMSTLHLQADDDLLQAEFDTR